MRRCARPPGLQAILAQRSRHQAQSSSSASWTTSEPREAFELDSATRTVQTPVGPLPISPLMDQAFYDAREKWKLPKPAKSPFKKTKFRHALERNPFARALASPSRKCQITQARLPAYFLQSFNLVAHPETGDPWWLPHDLLASQKSSFPSRAPSRHPPESSAAEPSSPAGRPVSEPSLSEEYALDSSTSSTESSAITTSNNPRPSLGTGYVLSWHPLLTGLASKSAFTGKYHHAFRRMMRSHTNKSGRIDPILNRTAWRTDMDAVVLDLMRRRLVDGLLELDGLSAQWERGYLVKCAGYAEVGSVLHPGCVLIFGGGLDVGNLEEQEVDGDTEGVERAEVDCMPSGADAALLGLVGGFATLDVRGSKFCHKVPVYDLDRLFGGEHVQVLRRRATVMQSGDMFVLARCRSKELQSWLWNLQGFVANIPPAEVTKGGRNRVVKYPQEGRKVDKNPREGAEGGSEEEVLEDDPTAFVGRHWKGAAGRTVWDQGYTA